MSQDISIIYLQFFGLIALTGAFTWGLMAAPMRIAPKASSLFSISNICMFTAISLYFFRSDEISYVHWYLADFIFLVGFCLLHWGGQQLFKQKLSISSNLIILSLTTLTMLLFPPQKAYSMYLMIIASLGALCVFIMIVKDNYLAMRASLSITYSVLLSVPFFLAAMFFFIRAILLLMYSDNAELVDAFTSLKSPIILWLYISFILSINCILFGNALTRLVQKIHKLAKKDQLTGLWNRHALMTRLQLVDALWKRDKQQYSILIIDLDYFKKINDTYGHLAGDTAIQFVANSLKSSLREIDFICRYGGEEFLVVLPNTDSDKAYQVAEKIQIQIAQKTLKWQLHEITIQLSIGYATIEDNLSVEQLLQRADDAMYQAKQHGRNTISTLPPTTVTQ
ncbi:GGDEF domain-containing protein [Shewanella gaetbuli]|uniref:diguanylate cyclase n=1 Tax=Shewanella gaetbuli TaxID=220752 RepID=A0A9X1ZRR7_9GAMM|nr:GGDEF domain-containing protein [Shewanella gaetbuli]MCL1144220.1 GGDEF domain-containing protein [Shewanella gaetbuli]